MLNNDNVGMNMPVMPAYGGGNAFGGDGWWILLLFLFAGGGMWGGMNGGGMWGGMGLYPWMNQADITTNGFAQAEIGANARQMADMQQQFALQQQLSQCCCDNRLATCQTQNIVQSEGAATRLAIQQQTQAILDRMCEDKIEQKNDTIAQLRSELLYARGQASQDVQTAAIQAGQRALANEVEQYVAPSPRPAYIVQNPNCCAQNMGCGCGI